MSQDFNNNSKITRIDKLDALLKGQPNDCFLLHALGLEYLKLENLIKAHDYFQEVIKINEGYVGTYYHLAKTLERLDRPMDAILLYKKGIQIAKEVKDLHAGNELKMALEELEEQ